jgi:hypothetical protein
MSKAEKSELAEPLLSGHKEGGDINCEQLW